MSGHEPEIPDDAVNDREVPSKHERDEPFPQAPRQEESGGERAEPRIRQHQPESDRSLARHSESGVEPRHREAVPGSDDPEHGVGRPEAVLLARQQRYWHGPLPHPSDLAEYDQIVPGAAERLVAAVIGGIEVDQKAVETAVAAEVRATATGQWMAYTIAVGALVAAIWFFAHGNPVAGTVFVGMPIAILVKSFLTGRSGGSDNGSEDA